MVKSGISMKQSKASCSAKPIGSGSTVTDLTPSNATSNYRGIFDNRESYSDSIKIIIKFLPNRHLFGAIDSFIEAVPQAIMFKCAFSAFRPLDKPQEIHLLLINESLVVLTKEKFIKDISLRVLPSTKFYSPSTNGIFSTLYQMGYQEKFKGVSEFKKGKLPAVWQYV